jgi:hypothetical protein
MMNEGSSSFLRPSISRMTICVELICYPDEWTAHLMSKASRLIFERTQW